MNEYIFNINSYDTSSNYIQQSGLLMKISAVPCYRKERPIVEENVLSLISFSRTEWRLSNTSFGFFTVFFLNYPHYYSVE